ncbi:unnamed protein product, partial [Medioppia subpectinata]
SIGFKIVAIIGPESVPEGSDVQIKCRYELYNETLYSMKYFYIMPNDSDDNEMEFFRWTPRGRPVKQAFPLHSFDFDVSGLRPLHYCISVYLTNVRTSGTYKCEMSVEGTFQTSSANTFISVEKMNNELEDYVVNVTERDDGSGGYGTQFVSTESVTTETQITTKFVPIVDNIGNKLVFKDCDHYTFGIEEDSPNGSTVGTVRAAHLYEGSNGRIKYSILRLPNEDRFDFVVDEVSGEVKTNTVFDREDSRYVPWVTVRASDTNSQTFQGFCTFTVKITDINDNQPLFDREEYIEVIKADTRVGTNIVRLVASDEDSGNNSAITYSLAPDPNNSTDVDYFRINPSSGWVSLEKLIGDQNRYWLRGVATDNGRPQQSKMVDIVINVVNESGPPVWDQPMYGPVSIREDLEIGQTVISLKARSGIATNPTVFYSLVANEPKFQLSISGGHIRETLKSNNFYLRHRLDDRGVIWADICVNSGLDYETKREYNLTVRAMDSGIDRQLTSETVVNIVLEDVNDEWPVFNSSDRVSVLEGMPPGTRVTRVQAIDRDGTHPNNQVSYAIVGGDQRFFAIDPQTGEIFTVVEFDREERQVYALLVRAEDGRPSDRRHMMSNDSNSMTQLIRIDISDKNDCPPFFYQSIYEAEVNEDEDIGHTFITLTAKDMDKSSKLHYEITRGNIGGVFAVDGESGAIYVSAPLDYERRSQYKLRLVASDLLNENYTTLVIYVKDVNDNPPHFDRQLYQTMLTEEDDNHLPKRVLQVSASDPNRHQNQQLVYFLSGEGVSETQDSDNVFTIDANTGAIYMRRPLDRDLPTGRPNWRFTVLAADEGGPGYSPTVGFADVLITVKDINDNAPVFQQSIYRGCVADNATAGTPVLAVMAIDNDDPNQELNAKVHYSIEVNAIDKNGDNVFSIDGQTGVISTAVCCLDPKTSPKFTIEVMATDGGGLKGSTTVFIEIKDNFDKC